MMAIWVRIPSSLPRPIARPAGVTQPPCFRSGRSAGARHRPCQPFAAGAAIRASRRRRTVPARWTIAWCIAESWTALKRASATSASAVTGFCLCGMAEEPPPPDSSISPPACAISAMSSPNLPRLPVTSDSQPANSAMLSRWLCHCGGRRARDSAASAARTRRRLVAQFLQRSGSAAELHGRADRRAVREAARDAARAAAPGRDAVAHPDRDRRLHARPPISGRSPKRASSARSAVEGRSRRRSLRRSASAAAPGRCR